MTTYDLVPPTADVVSHSFIKSLEERKAIYAKSLSDPNTFWSDYAKDNFRWQKFWDDDKVYSYNYDVRKGPIEVKWFEGGKTNVCYNCLDKHIKAGGGDKTAFLWEGNDVGEEIKITYKELYNDVCKMQTVLKKHGVTTGSKVTLYLPMVLALPVCMLACARMGAILNIVFAGFSATALAGRVANCQSEIIVTADAVMRGPKPIGLKVIVDEAIPLIVAEGGKVNTVIVYERKNRDIKMTAGRDVWYQDEMRDAVPDETLVWRDAEDPLFLLYTSGSTGKPKGVVHTTGGYMVYASITHKYIFDCHPSDVYWCTADIGWVTGHTYIVFGPLLNHATSVMFEGVPTHPDAGRCWAVCDKYKVNIFYTAPTAIRALMKFGDAPVKKHDLSSLRVLGSVGEPINVEAWKWFHEVVGNKKCAIVDTWWQTETGGILITPLPGSTPTKPSSATLPFFGVEPAILDEKGEVLEGVGTGGLVMKRPHPGICRTVYGDHKRYEETYFQMYPGYYFTGDGCRRDEDGYYWITGRVDDVLNVSGHRLGTAEIENAINSHPDVIESAVVGYPHDIKGVGIYAYITLAEGKHLTEDVKKSIAAVVRKIIGPIATPDIMHFAPGLPKTRSGKIMRRILRKIATNEVDQLGDITTLADPSVVEKLIASKPQ
jgi:acetyl-CoA synthetase